MKNVKNNKNLIIIIKNLILILCQKILKMKIGAVNVDSQEIFKERINVLNVKH